MARLKIVDFAVDANGMTVSGAQVEVRGSDGSLLTLYANETGATEAYSGANPFSAGDGGAYKVGYFEFWVNPSDYIEVTVGVGASANTYPIPVDKTFYYTSRTSLVSDVTEGVLSDLKDGTRISVGQFSWEKSTGATSISDMPDWNPIPPIYPDHFKENTTPGTTDMGDAISQALQVSGTVYFLDVPYASTQGVSLSDGDGFLGTTTSNTDVVNQLGSSIVFTGSQGVDADNVERLNLRDISLISSSSSTVARTFNGTNVYGSYFQNVRFENNRASSGDAFYNEIQSGEGAGVAWNNHFDCCWFSSEAGYSHYNEGTDSYYVAPYFTGGLGARIAASGTSINGAHSERGDEGLVLFDPEDRQQIRATVSGLYIDLCDKGLVFEAGRSVANTRMDIVVTGYTARSNTTADIVVRNTNSNEITGGYVVGYVTDDVATNNILEEPGTGSISDISVQKLSPGTIRYIGETEKDLVIGESVTGLRFLTSDLVYDRTGAGSANVVVGVDGTIKRSSSARKYKKDIQSLSLEDVRSFVEKAVPVRYKSATEDNDSVWYGYIADDVAVVDENLVQFGKDGSPEGFDYDRVPALLHVALKDILSRLEEIESKI